MSPSPSPRITSYLGLILHHLLVSDGGGWWVAPTTTETNPKTQLTFNLTFDTTLSNKTVTCLQTNKIQYYMYIKGMLNKLYLNIFLLVGSLKENVHTRAQSYYS